MEQSIDIVTRAEQVIKNLKERNLLMTTSQIRKFLTSVNTLNNKIQVFEMREKVKQMPKVSDIMLSDDLAMQIKYLKIIIAYQSGRIRKKNKENEVYQFVMKAKLNEAIDEIGNDIKKYKDFAKYIEALVAYHKFYGGKDE